MSSLPYKLGLPMWGNTAWKGSFFSSDAQASDFLAQYASVFNTVEGNTTFYAIPTEQQVSAWLDAVCAHDFAFCFKMPKLITHDLKLERCDQALSVFLNRIESLRPKMGPLMIQLPASFAPSHLPILERFIHKLSAAFQYSVEVRHPDFAADDHARALYSLLQKYRIEQVMFDTQALFASQATDEHTIDAKTKKPQLSVEPICIHKQPILRFIASSDGAQQTAEYFERWAANTATWIAAGKTPFILVHHANNAHAIDVAEQLHQQLAASIAGLPNLARRPCEKDDAGQMGLF